MFNLKLKAGALQFTLFISIVIALLLTAFILLIQTHKLFDVQTNFAIETIENSNRGIDYSLLNATRLNDTTVIRLNDEDYKALNIHREFWGAFERVTATSKIKTHTFRKTALIGAQQPRTNRTALYVQDNNRPLVLVGNTKIEGLAHLPRQGVKSGSISGQSYYGSQLIYGPTKTASNLPELFEETTANLRNNLKIVSKLSKPQYLNLESGQTYTNSFLNPVQVVFNPSTIRLSAVDISGHIIVQSQTKIILESSSNLKDVLLIAPKIEIKNNVKGTFQAIASKEILVERNCTLNYPSALVIVEKESSTIENTTQGERTIPLKIDSNSTMKGVVIYLGTKKQNNYNAQVSIGKDSTLHGEIYCSNNLELAGEVFGSVYTNNFTTKQAGSIYQNHIYNGTINIDSLNVNYIGLPFNNSKKGILKWLY